MDKTSLVRAGMWPALADILMQRASTTGNAGTVGTPGTGVTAVEYGDDVQHTSILTYSGSQAVAGAALGFGKLLYTFPAGSQIIQAAYMSAGITEPTTGTDTTKIGLGHVVASGAVSVLNGTATFMSILTEQTGASAGVAVVKTAIATASPFQYITDVGGVKAVYLNFASSWTDTGTATIAATVALRWLTMA